MDYVMAVLTHPWQVLLMGVLVVHLVRPLWRRAFDRKRGAADRVRQLDAARV